MLESCFVCDLARRRDVAPLSRDLHMTKLDIRRLRLRLSFSSAKEDSDNAPQCILIIYIVRRHLSDADVCIL